MNGTTGQWMRRLSAVAALFVAPSLQAQVRLAAMPRETVRALEANAMRAIREVGGISHANEARDAQQLFTLPAPGRAISDTAPKFGVLAPDTMATRRTLANFTRAGGTRVAVAHVTAAVANLPLHVGVVNEIYVMREGAKWYYQVRAAGKAISAKLETTRYTYRGLSVAAGDFPATARWDWEEGTGKQVAGMTCGDGWCQLGTATASVGPDPQDPDPTGAESEAATVRFRGWFDRAVTTAGTFVRIYPTEELRGWTKFPDFKQNKWREVAFILRDGSTARTPITIKATGSGNNPKNWTWKGRIAGPPPTHFNVDLDDTAGMGMPAAARWASGIVGFKTASMLTGDMWVRCANGCCTAEVDF